MILIKAMRQLRSLFLVLLLILLGNISGKGQNSTEYNYLFLEAEIQQQKGNFDSAFELLLRCTEINPQAAEAYYFLAPYYLVLKQKDKALAAYEKAVELCPDNLCYLEALARTYTASGRFDDAIRTLENFIAIDQSEESVLELLVTLYVQDSSNYSKAIETLNRLEALEGKSEQLSSTKSEIYSAMGEKDAAINEMYELACQYPNDLLYRCLYGDILLVNDRDDEALAVFQDVIAGEPDNSKAQMSLRSYYRKQEDTLTADSLTMRVLGNKNTDDEQRLYVIRQEIGELTSHGDDSLRILRFFDKAIQAETQPGAMGFACATYMDLMGMPRDTISTVLEAVLAKAPDYAAARLQLVAYAWEGHDMERVVELCAGARQYSPDEMVFYYYQGIALYQLEREDEALEAFRNGISVINSESNPAIVSDFYAVMGDIFYQKGLTEEAYAAYDSCLVWKDDNYGCLNNYAYYLSVKGERLDEAEEMSYRTIREEPKNATYLDTYAWIMFMQERYAEAKIYIDQALQNDTDSNAVIIEHAGDIAAMTDDMPAALEFWQQSLERDPENALLRRKIEQKKYIKE